MAERLLNLTEVCMRNDLARPINLISILLVLITFSPRHFTMYLDGRFSLNIFILRVISMRGSSWMLFLRPGVDHQQREREPFMGLNKSYNFSRGLLFGLEGKVINARLCYLQGYEAVGYGNNKLFPSHSSFRSLLVVIIKWWIVKMFYHFIFTKKKKASPRRKQKTLNLYELIRSGRIFMCFE